MEKSGKILVAGAILTMLAVNFVGQKIGRHTTKLMEREGVPASRLEHQANVFHYGIIDRGKHDYDGDGRKDPYISCRDGSILAKLSTQDSEDREPIYFRVD